MSDWYSEAAARHFKSRVRGGHATDICAIDVHDGQRAQAEGAVDDVVAYIGTLR
jgi:hypothetical protein